MRNKPFAVYTNEKRFEIEFVTFNQMHSISDASDDLLHSLWFNSTIFNLIVSNGHCSLFLFDVHIDQLNTVWLNASLWCIITFI